MAEQCWPQSSRRYYGSSPRRGRWVCCPQGEGSTPSYRAGDKGKRRKKPCKETSGVSDRIMCGKAHRWFEPTHRTTLTPKKQHIMIFKQKKQNTFETQDEWFDRLTLNIGKAVCLLGIALAICAAVAHVATGLWLNLLMDAAVMAGAIIGLTHNENI